MRGVTVSDLSGLSRPSVHVLAAVAAASGVVAVGLLGRRVVVRGDSMMPTLQPDDRLLLVRSWWPRPGYMVAVRDPRARQRLLVKRVAGVDRRSRLVTVLGDNPGSSTDSRDFGPVPLRSVLGRVVYRYAPVARAGWVR